MSTLLDPALGPTGEQAAAAIAGICGDALQAVLGSELARAETADLAVILTLGRITDQVLGAGSGARHPAANELGAPWLPTLQLGYRIGLLLELLRLSDPGP